MSSSPSVINMIIKNKAQTVYFTFAVATGRSGTGESTVA